MRVTKYDGTVSLAKKHKQLTGNTLEDAYLFWEKNAFVGYAVIIENKLNTATIDWIWGPDFGKKIMKKIESLLLKKKINTIFLNVSLDPNENKNNVIRRLNFYIGLQYKVDDIVFRPKNGPLLKMHKELKL